MSKWDSNAFVAEVSALASVHRSGAFTPSWAVLNFTAKLGLVWDHLDVFSNYFLMLLWKKTRVLLLLPRPCVCVHWMCAALFFGTDVRTSTNLSVSGLRELIEWLPVNSSGGFLMQFVAGFLYFSCIGLYGDYAIAWAVWKVKVLTNYNYRFNTFAIGLETII